MSSVGASLKDSSRRQYISTGDFSGQFFTYSTSVNASLVTVGTLTAIVADAYDFQPGQILRETGRKLIECVNPGLVDPNSGSVYTYLVGGYDANSCLSGFIDPNCSVFAPFNSDKPYFLDTTTEAVDASVDPAIKDEGAPVYTNGDITSILGNIVASNGNISAMRGSMYASTTMTAVSTITSTNGNIVASQGNIVASNGTVSAVKYLVSPVGSGGGSSGSPLTTSAGSANFNGAASASQTIYTNKLTSSSLIFLTVNNVGPRSVSVNPVPASGYFTAHSGTANDSSTFYWMIVN